MQAKLKCAIYTRVSTDNQAEVEFNSCEAQESKIRSFIESQENMEIFIGRLTRSPRDFYQLIELFDKYGVDFISVTERFDTSTPSGRLLRNIMLTFAQFERELISERTRDKMLERSQKGMWNGAKPPFGYKPENKKLVVIEDEAKIVNLIYEKYVTGVFVATIAKETDLPKNKIALILRNPIYTGKLRYTGKISQGIHKPIIFEEIFNFAQSLHKEKIVKMKPVSINNKHLINPQHVQRDEKFSNGVNDSFPGGENQKNREKIRGEFSLQNIEPQVRNSLIGVANGI